jgi:hypothetical protein
MMTAIEVDRHGNIARIFHRRGDRAWTHSIGDEGRYWSDRWDKWVELRCECPPGGTSNPSPEPEDSAEPRSRRGGRSARLSRQNTQLMKAAGDG